jgi:hypothetical protein
MARFEPLLSANIATNTQNENAIVAAPGAGKKIRVHSYRLVGGNSATANVCTWLDGTGGTVKETIDVLANTGSAPVTQRPDFLFELSANKALVLNLSAAQRVTGGVTYSVVPSSGVVDG